MPLPHLDANVLEAVGVLADGQLEIEFLFDFVDQQHGPGIGMEKFVDFLHNRAQNLVQL